MKLFLAAQQSSCGGVQLSVKLPGIGDCVPHGKAAIYAYLQAAVNIFEGLLGIAIVLAIVISGVQYILSAGSPDATKSAKGRLTNAVLALVLYLLMFGILKIFGVGLG